MVRKGEVVTKSELARRLNVQRQTIADLMRLHRIDPVPFPSNGMADGIDHATYLRLAPYLTPTATAF